MGLFKSKEEKEKEKATYRFLADLQKARKWDELERFQKGARVEYDPETKTCWLTNAPFSQNGFCTNCGAEFQPETAFCTQCGAKKPSP